MRPLGVEQRKNDSSKRYLCLLTSSVKENDEEDLRFCFSVMSPDKVLTLQAENEAEKQEWIQVIQVCCFCLLLSLVLTVVCVHRA